MRWDRFRARSVFVGASVLMAVAASCGGSSAKGPDGAEGSDGAESGDSSGTDAGPSGTSTGGSDDTDATGLVVEASFTQLTLDPGQDESIGLVAHDDSGVEVPVPEGVVWSSSDSAVATVDGAGLVVAIATGDATVSASIADQVVDVDVRVRGFTTALLSTGINGATEIGMVVGADGHGIVTHWDRKDGQHEATVHRVEGAAGWMPNVASVPGWLDNAQAVRVGDRYLLQLGTGNEPLEYHLFEPGAGLQPHPLQTDTLYSDLVASAATQEAFVLYSDTYYGPLKATGIEPNGTTDFGTIDPGALLAAAFDGDGRGLVVTRVPDSQEIHVIPYEPGSGFGAAIVVPPPDAEYVADCTRIAVNDAGRGAILQLQWASGAKARIIPIAGGTIGDPDPAIADSSGLRCHLSITRSGRIYLGRDDASTAYDDIRMVEYANEGTVDDLGSYAMTPADIISNGDSAWMLGFESGIGASGKFAARRFDEDHGWQDALLPSDFTEMSADADLTLTSASDGSMLGVVQNGPLGSFYVYGFVYR